MITKEIDNIKYWVCCPMCDNEKCVRGTDACEAEQWAKSKAESEDYMAYTDTELMIKIPDRIYYGIEKGITVNGSSASQIALDAIKNGILFPKGEHGRLIDVDEAIKKICIENKANSVYELTDELKSFIKKYLNEAPTILKPTMEYMIKNYAFSKKED